LVDKGDIFFLLDFHSLTGSLPDSFHLMLSTCFFPKSSSVLDDMDETSHLDEMKFDVASRVGDEEIDLTFDDDVAQEIREEVNLRDDAEKNSSSVSSSIIGDFAVFRDFFLAAFSDGYYKVGQCYHKNFCESRFFLYR
jgi:hypothetical protein